LKRARIAMSLLSALLLVSCTPPSPPPPTATPRPPIRRPVVWQATQAEDIVGTWVDYGCWYWGMSNTPSTRTEGYWYQFREDGTYRVAFQTAPDADSRVQALRDLEAAPRVEGIYWFYEDSLHLKLGESADEAALDWPEAVGIYEVRVIEFFGKVSIKLYEIEDESGLRASQLEIMYMQYR
jgi:hypothetical protein